MIETVHDESNPKLKQRGVFITLEGIDGAGKSTQFRLLVQHLRKLGYKVCATREPGGTRVGERIRRILLASNSARIAPLAELALMYAARAQHLEEIIRPALARGKVVVSDRFNDASFAYQGYGRRIGVTTVQALDRIICGRTQPHRTLVLDLSPEIGLGRAHGRETRRVSKQTRFEAQGAEFLERVRSGYLAMARRAPHRVKVVRADRPVAEIQAEIRKLVESFLESRFRHPGLGARGSG